MPRPKKKSRKNKSFFVVKEGVKTIRPSRPGKAERDCDKKDSSMDEKSSDIQEEGE